jgi:hypothetical protein
MKSLLLLIEPIKICNDIHSHTYICSRKIKIIKTSHATPEKAIDYNQQSSFRHRLCRSKFLKPCNHATVKQVSQCDLKPSQTSHTTVINSDQFAKRQTHLEFRGYHWAYKTSHPYYTWCTTERIPQCNNSHNHTTIYNHDITQKLILGHLLSRL